MKEEIKEIGNLYNKGIKKGIEETNKEFQENEIKEIINKIKKNSNHKEDINHYNRLNLKECNLLLDYITNLQTIEKEYSFLLSENAELENKITNLQEENERLRKELELCKKNGNL